MRRISMEHQSWKDNSKLYYRIVTAKRYLDHNAWDFNTAPFPTNFSISK